MNSSDILSPSSKISAIKEQVSSDIGDEIVILQISSGKYFSLNEVGARIWSLIQEAITIHEIRDVLVSEYEVEADECEQDLFRLLQTFLSQGLVDLVHAKTT